MKLVARDGCVLDDEWDTGIADCRTVDLTLEHSERWAERIVAAFKVCEDLVYYGETTGDINRIIDAAKEVMKWTGRD